MTLRTTENSGVHLPNSVVRTTSRRLRDGFESGSLDSAKWTSSVGSGGSITQSGGTLTLGSGTTANAETSVTSVLTFNTPVRFAIGLNLSQRIANTTFLVELVSVDSVTELPDDKNIAAWVFDGTSATQAKYRIKSQNGTQLDSGAVTIPTTATASTLEIEPNTMDTWWHTQAFDTTAARTQSYRRNQKAIDPDCRFKIRLRWLNGATPPASNSNAVISFIACQDTNELTAEINSTRGQISAGVAMPVTFAATPTVSANSTSQDNLWNQESVTAQAGNATVTGTSRDVGVAGGTAHRYAKFNTYAFADVAGTLRIEVSNDNTNWRRATADTAVAANTPVILSVPTIARYHRAVFVNGASAQTTFIFNTSFTSS